MSGEAPDTKIAVEGIMLVAGLFWDVLSDTFKIKIPKVYFSQKVKGNMEGIETFVGKTVRELKDFFPENLTSDH